MADWDEPQNPTATERADAKAYQGRIADLERQIAELRAELTDQVNISIRTEARRAEATSRAEAAEAENARLRALPLKDEVERVVDVDALAQEIRRVDGNHDLGAGALAEALLPFFSRLRAGEQDGWLADRALLAEAASDPSLSDGAVRALCTARHGEITEEVRAWADCVLSAAPKQGEAK